MIKLALIGSDVAQSKSAPIHEFILGELGYSCAYEHISVSEERLPYTVKKLLAEYGGFNVTKPYKEKVIAYLDELCGAAALFKSVNTVKCGECARGYSTDGDGFIAMLDSENIEYANKKILMLGSGGAARSVIYPLIRAGADIEVYNRTAENAYRMREEIGGFTVLESLPSGRYYDAVINTTSAGMGRLENVCPASDFVLANCGAAVDLIYRPRRTLFLKSAEKLGKKALNGAKMLFFQAYYSDCIYIERESDGAEAQELYKKFERKGIL